jgi:PAS domain S-box-containing protein
MSDKPQFPGRAVSFLDRPDLVVDSDYRLLVESVTDYAIFMLDPQGYIRSWSEGARRLKGYETNEIIGKHFSIFYPRERLDEGWPEKELALAREHGRIEDEGWRVRKDGTRFWASVVITKLVDADGVMRGFSKITRDLTQRRRNEELLRQSEERFRLLVGSIKDYAIFMLDPSGHVISWNAGAALTKGYTEHDIIGKHFSIFYPEEVAASGWPDKALELALRDGRFEDEGWRVCKNGARFWANVVITAVRDRHGRHRGFVKVTRDMTDRKRITALEDEGRRMYTFLAMLGHELRNPLTPITNALSVLDIASERPELIAKARGVIGRQVEQLSHLVDDLLDVGRIANGKIVLHRQLLRMQEVIDSAVESVQPLIQRRSHTLNLQIVDPSVQVLGDRTRLIQALGNVLHNAAKFTPPDGEIDLSLETIDTGVRISIKDNGPGIPARILPRIFDLFVQGDQASDRAQGGLGLGLALARQIVLLHGGTVEAHSAGQVGQGSEFVILLPRVKGQTAPRPTVSLEPSLPQRILVVDDNRDAADTMVLLLQSWGYSTTTAYDGLSALKEIEKHRPDLMFVDLGLPGINGYELAKRVFAQGGKHPIVIAITGYGQESDKEATTRAGFYAHLTKPVPTKEIASLLKNLFGNA